MNIQTNIGALKIAIKKVLKAVDASACAIAVQGNHIRVIAGTMNGHIEVDLPSQGDCPDCSAVIDARQVGAILGSIKEDAACVIKPLETGLQLTFAGARIKLNRPFEDTTQELFAVSKSAMKIDVFRMAGKEFEDLVAGPLHHVSRTDIRPSLLGLHLEADEGLLRAVGTNGISLCSARSEIDVHDRFEPVLMPCKTAEAFGEVFEPQEEVTVRQVGEGSSKRLLFSGERVRWVAALIDAPFPDWRRVMPQPQRPWQATVSRAALLAAVARVMAAAAENFVVLWFREGLLQVESADGEQHELLEMDAQLKHDDGIRLGATGKILLRALESVRTDEFVFAVDGTNDSSRFVLTDKDRPQDQWFAIAMPARI